MKSRFFAERLRYALAALFLLGGGHVHAQEASELVVGHWLQVKGQLREDGVFVAGAVELLEPEDSEVVIATVQSVSRESGYFEMLGQRFHVSEKTKWKDRSLQSLTEERLKVEGHYRGPSKFSARSVSSRGSGRDRLEGRIDAIRHTAQGVELSVMRWRVWVPADIAIEHESGIASYGLAAPRRSSGRSADRDDDDDVPGSIRLSDELFLGVRLEWRSTHEDGFNLDDGDPEDRRDDELTVRTELTWRPTGQRFYGLIGARHTTRLRDDEDEGGSTKNTARLSEIYGYWDHVGGYDLDLQVGRQDFDDPREWLYDQNLDALRLIYRNWGLRTELSASTTLAGGSPKDEATDNLIAYVTNGDPDRTLGAYIIDRRDRRGVRDYPLHLGVRALGEWLPDHESWAELSIVRGYEGSVDLRGHGFDLGTTWEPRAHRPWHFTLGYAYGSGDSDPGDGVDHAFRQTGLQDNNAKVGGVTSIRYYGELVDPELSNLAILTLGGGARIAKNTSLDLLLHYYAQNDASTVLRNTSLDKKPDGVHTELGWEVDLILGSRAVKSWDVELVGAAFLPGDAFSSGDTAYLAKLQLRYSF